MKFTHDVIVIGGGAAGLTAAGGCALFGLKVALIEGHKMGGECLNNGCVPSKALITAAKRAAEARIETLHGVTLAAPKIEWSGVHKHIHAAIAHIAPHDSEETFEEMGCEVIRDYARITGKHTVGVGSRTLSAPRIVVATGSRPFFPPIPGLDGVPYLTNENLFDLSEQPGHLIIIGGGVIGMEMAQSFCRLGSEVTVIEPANPMGRDDQDNVQVVIDTMKAEGVNFVKGEANGVSGIQGALEVQVDNGKTIKGTHILLAVGRRANTSGFGLEELGVEMARNGIKVDARRRTSVKSIYAIGDCRDGPRLTHVSGYEGSNVALEIVTGLPTKVDWKALPWCTFTEPEVAQIGMTEAEAREELGDKITVQESTWNCTMTVSLNHNHPAFKDQRVRRALTLAIDRWGGSKYLSEIAIMKTVGGLVFPGHPLSATKAELEKIDGYWPDIEKSRAEAKRLLKEAGFENLSFNLSNRNVDQPYKIAGTWLIGEWKKIGVTVTSSALAE